LPADRSERYQREWQLPPSDAEALVVSRPLAEYFETVASKVNPRLAANWVRNEVLRILNDRAIDLAEFRLSAEMLAELIQLVESGVIGGKIAKEVFDEVADSGGSPRAIVERKGLSQVSDPAVVRDAVTRVIERHPEQVALFRSGREQVFGFLVGQVMKETRGRANAPMVNSILRELLGG
ncbi:MAG TPA: Asp-tRNA(Asn)/Glu-tRNA(Gln) amidotransferase GatCAB subunit B, partial [Thermoanaerobaculia bacterium]|nr:Asp-tRNA(Asn)/Glu-tRNA(Gln) amidotransferase GatCAB subunit B [Thermoanaerobaculia bacterium]